MTLVGSIAIGEEEGLVGVELWAEVRRMHRVDGLSGREISRRTGLARETVARLLAAREPPRYQRESAGSKLDPFKGWICERLAEDPRIQSQRPEARGPARDRTSPGSA